MFMIVKAIYKTPIILALSSCAAAAENIIQQENMSLDKCIEVISTSTKKLSIEPEISEPSNKQRIAIYTLSDGKLKIFCDGVDKLVTVSILTN